MALLRPCGRIFRTFGNLSASCQIECIRGVGCTVRGQGYVTLAKDSPSRNTSAEKFDLMNNINISHVSKVSTLRPGLYKRLVSLCHNAKSEKTINEDLLELLETSAGGKIALDDAIGVKLLRNCSDTFSFLKVDERINLTNLLWEAVKKRSSALTVAHYNALLRTYVENRHAVEPKKFFEFMNAKPDEETYRLLMRSAAQTGDVESAAHVFTMMKNAEMAVDEDIFNLLIEAHANNKDIESALSVLRTMKKSGIEPSAETHAKIAAGYASIGDIENTLQILNDGAFVERQILEIAKRATVAGYGKYIPAVLKHLPEPVNRKSPTLLRTMKEIVDAGYPEEALELINCSIQVYEIHEKHPVYEAFLSYVVYSNVPSATILKFAERISTEMRYPFALVDLGEAALQNARQDLIMAVFETMQDQGIPVRPHYYWPLLIQASKLGGEAEIFRVIKHMLCLNVPVNFETLRSYIFFYISTVDPLIALRKLNDIGLEMSKIFTPFICYLLYQGRLKETLMLCYKIRTQIDFSHVTEALVTAYKCTRHIYDCAKIFKFAPPQEYYPDKFLLHVFGENPKADDARILKNFLQVFRELKIPVQSLENDVTLQYGQTSFENKKIPDPTEMNVEQLECHLIELRAKKMNERSVMRKLMRLHCRDMNINRVDELRKEFEDNGFPWTPGMYAGLVQVYAQEGRVVEALDLYHHLQKNYSNFRIDDFKVILLATALVKVDRISDAIELLKRTRSNGGERIQPDCWRLLNTVVHSSNSELTGNILDILVSSGFCEKNKVLLGPLVREHLLKNDLEAAVDTVRECAERYKCMPLRQELINVLVKSINTDETKRDRSIILLQQVQDLCAKNHCSREVIMDLAIAFARNEMRNNLQKLFKTCDIPNELVITSLNYLPENAKIPVLMAILDVTTEESQLNRLSIYECILSLCNRSGDCERAIETRRKLLADDNVTESRVFREQFFDLLKRHKVPVPEDFVRKQEV